MGLFLQGGEESTEFDTGHVQFKTSINIHIAQRKKKNIHIDTQL